MVPDNKPVTSTSNVPAVQLSATPTVDLASKFDKWDTQYLQLIVSEAVLPKDGDAVLAMFRQIVSGKQDCFLDKYLDKGSEVLTPMNLDKMSDQEVSFYYSLVNMFQFIGSNKMEDGYSGTITATDRIEARKQIIETLGKQIAFFCKETKTSVKSGGFKAVLFDAVKTASAVAYGSGILGDEQEENYSSTLKPYIALAAKTVFDSLPDDKRELKAINTAKEKVMENMKPSHSYLPQLPTNMTDRYVLQIYAQFFTMAGLDSFNAKVTDANYDSELLKFVSENIRNFSNSTSLSHLSQRYLVFKGIIKDVHSGVEKDSDPEIIAYAGKKALSGDFYGDKNAASTPLDGRINDILDGSSTTVLRLSIAFKKDGSLDKITKAEISDETGKYQKIQDDHLGQMLSFALSNMFGVPKDKAADINFFFQFLYSMCLEDDKLKKDNIKAAPGDFNVSITIDKGLLTKIFSEYFISQVSNKQRFIPENTTWENIKIEDTMRIADESPIIAMKCVNAARGKPFSSLRMEMLTPTDIATSADTFKAVDDKQAGVNSPGLSDTEAKELKDFSKDLQDGKYAGLGTVMQIRGGTTDKYCLISLKEVKGQEKFNKAVQLLNKIASQLVQITPAEDLTQIWNPFVANAKQEKQKVKLNGVETQLLYALKSRFFQEKISAVYGALEKNDWDISKITKEQQDEVDYFTGGQMDIKLWNAIKEKFPGFFKTLTDVSTDLQLDIKYPFKFNGGEIAHNDVEFINIVFSYENKWDSLSLSPGEPRQLSIAKQMVSMIISKLGLFIIEDKNLAADIIGAFPASEAYANLLFKTASYGAELWGRSTGTFKTDGTDFGSAGDGTGDIGRADGLTSDTKWVQDILNITVNKAWGKIRSQMSNPENVRNNFVPYIHMFLMQAQGDDPKERVKFLMDILHEDKNGKCLDKLATLDLATANKAVKAMSDYRISFSALMKTNPNIAKTLKSDKSIQKYIDSGMIDVSSGEIVFKDFDEKTQKFLGILSEKYNGKLKDIYYEKTRIPADIREYASYFTDVMQIVSSLQGIAQDQPGIIAQSIPKSAEDIRRGWEFGNKTDADKQTFRRFTQEQGDVNPSLIGQPIQDDSAIAKRWVRAVPNVAGYAISTSFDYFVVNLYFARNYVNLMDKLMDSVMARDPEKFEATIKDVAMLLASMANYGLNPLVMLNPDKCKELWHQGKYEELTAYIMINASIAVQTSKRLVTLTRNSLRAIAGKGKLTMGDDPNFEKKYGEAIERGELPANFKDMPMNQWSLLEKPVEFGENGLIKVFNWNNVKDGRSNPVSRLAGGLDNGLGNATAWMEKHFTSSRLEKNIVKRIVWDEIIRLQSLSQVWEWGGQVISRPINYVGNVIKNKIVPPKKAPVEPGPVEQEIMEPAKKSPIILAETKILLPGDSGYKVPADYNPKAKILGGLPYGASPEALNTEKLAVEAAEKALSNKGKGIFDKVKGSNWALIAVGGVIVLIDVRNNMRVKGTKEQLLKAVARDSASVAIFVAGDTGLEFLGKTATKAFLQNSLYRLPVVGMAFGAYDGIKQNSDELSSYDSDRRNVAVANIIEKVADNGISTFGMSLSAEGAGLMLGSTALTGGGIVVITVVGALGFMLTKAAYDGAKYFWYNGTQWEEVNNAVSIEKSMPNVLKVNKKDIPDDFRKELETKTDTTMLSAVLSVPENQEKIMSKFSSIEVDSPYLISTELINYLLEQADNDPALAGKKLKAKVSLDEGVEINGPSAYPKYIVTFFTEARVNGKKEVQILSENTYVDKNKNLGMILKIPVSEQQEKSMRSVPVQATATVVDAEAFSGTSTARATPDIFTRSFTVETMKTDSVKFSRIMEDIPMDIMSVLKDLKSAGYMKSADMELIAALNGTPKAFRKYLSGNKEAVQKILVDAVKAYKGSTDLGPADISTLSLKAKLMEAIELENNKKAAGEKNEKMIKTAQAFGRKWVYVIAGDDVKKVAASQFGEYWVNTTWGWDRKVMRQYAAIEKEYIKAVLAMNKDNRPGRQETRSVIILPSESEADVIVTSVLNGVPMQAPTNEISSKRPINEVK